MTSKTPKTFTVGDFSTYRVFQEPVRDHKKKVLKNRVYIQRISRNIGPRFHIPLPIEEYFKQCQLFNPIKITEYYD